LSPDSVGFILDLLFEAEDGGNIFLRSVRIPPNYRALQPRSWYSFIYFYAADTILYEAGYISSDLKDDSAGSIC
jgi:hypothetical protein